MTSKEQVADPQDSPDGQGAEGSGRAGRLQQLLVQAANLTGAEARVAAALLGLRTATLKQLSETTDMSRSHLYPLLDSLSVKGVCQRLPGKQALWECPEPKEVLARLRSAQDARLQATAEATARGFEEAEAMLAAPASGTEDPPIRLVDITRTGVTYLDAMASVDYEILVLNRGPYPGEVEPSPPVLEALARGVKARALYVSDELDAPDGQLRRCADAYAAAGAELRVVNSLPVAMAVIGPEIALLAVPAGDASSEVPGQGAVIHSENLVQLVSAAFEHMWGSARPYAAAAPGRTKLRIVATEHSTEGEMS